MFVRCMAVALLALSGGGCATITQGTEQIVAVKSNPSGALCTLSRSGTTIATVPNTPQHVMIPKSIHDVHVSCTKPGFVKATALLPSQVDAMVAGNLIIGGVVGAGIDAASGAMNKYPKEILIQFPGAPPAVVPKSPDEKNRNDGPPIG